MTSGFSGDFFYGSGGGGSGRPFMAANGGNQGGVAPYGLRQQQQQQGIYPADQIAQRRAELLMGKRSFGDIQSYQQQIHLLQQQQQQQSQPHSIILQQQYLRSVKQRNNNFVSSPISPLSPSIDLCSPNNSLSHEFINPSSSARVGMPVYQQLRSQQPQISLLNQPNQINPTNTSLIQACNNNTFTSNNGNKLLNPAQNGTGFSPVGYPNFGSNLIQTKPGRVLASDIGLSNLSPNPVQHKPDPEDPKILNTLEELEKQLLNDDDNQEEGDAVSAITNSEWSETFKNLMGPGPDPIRSPPMGHNANMGSVSTSNNSTTNNNMISPSPTSSTSSCCSTSASQATVPPPMPTKKLISDAGSAISDGKIDAAMEALGRLTQAANPRGSSEQRLAFYMSNALRSRACPNENPPPIMELYGKEQMSAMYALYDLSPCFKFGLLTANLVMLEAITSALQEGLKIHVVDFHVGHLGQYVDLLRALAERRSQSGNRVATELRITVVETELGNGAAAAEPVKNELVMLAERVGINLRFDVVTRKINELTSESLGCEDGEAVVVNFAFELHRVPDESVSMENLRDELLRRMKSLSPRAVTLVEQDMNGNTAPFMTRVNEACAYYGALLDSLESTIPKDNPDRAWVEEGLGRKIANAVACEGRERVERAEVFGKWRARMGMAGFELKPLSQSVAESMRAKLNSARSGNPGFTVKEESGGVGFGWMGRTLTVASAWR